MFLKSRGPFVACRPIAIGYDRSGTIIVSRPQFSTGGCGCSVIVVIEVSYTNRSVDPIPYTYIYIIISSRFIAVSCADGTAVR